MIFELTQSISEELFHIEQESFIIFSLKDPNLGVFSNIKVSAQNTPRILNYTMLNMAICVRDERRTVFVRKKSFCSPAHMQIKGKSAYTCALDYIKTWQKVELCTHKAESVRGYGWGVM